LQKYISKFEKWQDDIRSVAVSVNDYMYPDHFVKQLNGSRYMSSHFDLKVLFLDDQDALVTGNDE
jgi:hypothetical protein